MSLPESARWLLDVLVKRVRSLPVRKKIVFPEGSDPRVIEAAARLAAEGGEFWVSIVIRDRSLVSVARDTQLLAGDEVLVLGVAPDSDGYRAVAAAFDPTP